MSVGRKLLLSIFISVALVTIPAAGAIYAYIKQKMLENESSMLLTETNAQVANYTKIMRDYEWSLKAFSRILSSELSAPIKAGEAEALDRLLHKDKDGAWRNRRQGFDGNFEAGIFLPPDALLDNNQKILHLRTKRAMDMFGSAITSSYGNIWLLTHDKTEVIYDHGYPDFVFLMPANIDYTQTPWFTLGDPANNPKREVRWTPPLFDLPSKSWLVSAILPLDMNGRWIGSIGRDISISKELIELLEKNQRYAGELRFVLDEQDHYIVAGPWQDVLETNSRKFVPNLANEPDLAKLLAHKDAFLLAHIHQLEVSFQGRKYLAIDANMPITGWRYIQLIPVSEILAPVQHLFYALMALVLAVGLFVGFLIHLFVQRKIINRLQVLAGAALRYGLGDFTARANLEGGDELAMTSHEFDVMAQRVERDERELKLIMSNIAGAVSRVDNQLRYIYVSAQYPIIFGKPIDKIVGHTMLELLGEDLFKQEEPYIKLVLAGEKVSFEIHQTFPKFGKMFGLVNFSPNFDANQQVDGFFISVVDITSLKKTQEDLSKRDARWKFAIEGFGDCLWEVNEIEQTITYSKAWFDIIGFSSDEVDDRVAAWESRIHPDDRAATLAEVKNCHQGKTPTYRSEYRTLCKDGTYKWILDRGVILEWSSTNQPLLMIGTSTDISGRKHIEQVLIES